MVAGMARVVTFYRKTTTVGPAGATVRHVVTTVATSFRRCRKLPAHQPKNLVGSDGHVTFFACLATGDQRANPVFQHPLINAAERGNGQLAE